MYIKCQATSYSWYRDSDIFSGYSATMKTTLLVLLVLLTCTQGQGTTGKFDFNLKKDAPDEWILNSKSSPNVSSAMCNCNLINEHIDCTCYDDTTTPNNTTTNEPTSESTDANNSDRTVLSATTGLLAGVSVGVVIGWVITCMLMSRRYQKYSIGPEQQSVPTLIEDNYSTLEPTYETLCSRDNPTFNTSIGVGVSGPRPAATPTSPFENTYSQCDNNKSRDKHDNFELEPKWLATNEYTACNHGNSSELEGFAYVRGDDVTCVSGDDVTCVSDMEAQDYEVLKK